MYEFLMAKEESKIITEIFGFRPRNDGLEPRRSVSGHAAAQVHREIRTHSVAQIQVDDDTDCCRSWQICLNSASTALSAGLYLCDFVSNILVALQYYEFYHEHIFDHAHMTAAHDHSHIPLRALIACLALMLVSHLGNVLAFALILPSEEHPLRSAYFLPLAQIQRLLTAFWRTAKCGRGSKPREPSETEALYAILSVAEAGPQLSLQFFVIVELGGGSSSWQPSVVLVISVLASLLSAGYNAGRSIMYQSSMRWTLALNTPGIAGGMYTIGALLLRCTAIASVALSVRVSGLSQYKMVGLFMAFLVIPVACVNGVISLWPTMSELGTNVAKLQALIAFYIGIFIGPLYPVVHGYRQTRMSYRIPLAITTLMNMLVDVIALGVLVLLNWSTCNFSKHTRTMAESQGANIPYLSSTLKCPQFLGFVGTGACLTLASSVVFICSVAGSRYQVLEGERLIRLENRGGLGCSGSQLEPN
ncbi:hypothetical protein Mapa_010912 [Marchantia paleacea]|nr:hypothetical protein Mapa_010912 [Marchantia paleacea]